MHQKHPKIARRALGHYARSEYALVGTTCVRMEAFMDHWALQLAEKYRVLKVTGEHQDAEVPTALRYERKLYTCDPAPPNEYDDKLLGGAYDLALVNGNHYPARRQIVFIDPDKAGTLERRRAQLTDVAFLIFTDEHRELPQWLQDHLEETHAQLPVTVSLEEAENLYRSFEVATPPVRAIILAGGKSRRMGEDKSKIIYRDGQTEIERLAGICERLGIPASVSVRATDEAAAHGLPQIEDRFLGLGPMGAICSAFLTDPDARWLVLACDLPLLGEETISSLLKDSDPRKYATAVRGPEQEWPEPLIALYEPRAYQRLLQFLALGYSCPRKLLINSEVEIVQLSDSLPILNANTPEERVKVLGLL